MVFVIQGMKYDTEKMRKVATVKKWYREDTFLNRAMFPGQEVGRTHECELWKSEKGNWLLTHEMDYSKSMGEAITEEEAKELLMRYAMPIYEKNVWRVAGSVKGAKRNPVARWGTKTTGLELNTHIITQDIEERKRFFSIYRKKGGNHGDMDYFSGSRSRNIDFGSHGHFCLCGSSESLERII